MFEFSIALRYLLPKRSQKTISFVGLLASIVIAVILWLLLVFVSITHSIQHQWLSKMTALSAPLRIKPSKAYFNSYYYQIDQHTEASNFRTKSLIEKINAPLSDPFNPDVDENIAHLPMPDRSSDGHIIDPAKRLDLILKKYEKQGRCQYQEYALSAGALHLNYKQDGQSQTLNQILYVTSYSKDALCQGQMIEKWDQKDINHLIKNAFLDNILWNINETLDSAVLKSIKLHPFKVLLPPNFNPPAPLQEAAALYNAEGKILSVMLLDKNSSFIHPQAKKGIYDFQKQTFQGTFFDKNRLSLSEVKNITLEGVKHTNYGIRFLFKAESFSRSYFFDLAAEEFSIEDFALKKSSMQKVKELLNDNSRKNTYPVLAPKSFKDQGAKIGDKGYVSYGAKTLSGFQEMKAPIVIAGFYDPGIFSVGAKVLIGSRQLIDLIGTSATTYALDMSETNGFLVFTNNFSDAKHLKAELAHDLKAAEISSYFDIQTYDDYPFVKEILDQFSSDKLIFYLVAFIIFIVALSNVAFLMQLLVRDKGTDMAIIRSLGASMKSLQKIFVYSGAIMGIFSAVCAFILAFMTLHYIQPILSFISFCIGGKVNLSQFYGIASSVSLDKKALISLFIFTPLLSSIAAFLAVMSIRKKTASEFLKDSK